MKRLYKKDGVNSYSKIDLLADAADKLSTARTIALSGNLSGSTSFDGSANATISASLAQSLIPRQAKQLASGTDLNGFNHTSDTGYYYAGGGNACLNKPDNLDAFGMVVIRIAGGYVAQIIVSANVSPDQMWIRSTGGSTWTSWKRLGWANDDLDIQTINL